MLPAFSTLGSGPTVLMLHGMHGGHRMFAPQVESFAGAGYRAVAWDMPAFGGPEGPWQRAFVAQRSALLDASPGMDVLAERLLPGLVGPAALPEGVALARSCLADVYPATWRRVLHALPAFDRRAALARIRVPTLLLAGEHDTLAPPALVQKMAARIPASTCVVLRGVGHLLALEAPDDFDGAVLGFLALPAALH